MATKKNNSEETRFAKGREKTGGRKPGTPNKTTRELREALTPLMAAYFSGMADPELNFRNSWAEDLEQMAPSDRARCMQAMAPFVIPKLQNIEIKEKTDRKGMRDELKRLEKEESEEEEDDG